MSCADIKMVCESNLLHTPAFIYDEKTIIKNLAKLRKIRDCQLLYPLKPCSCIDILKLLAPLLDGFSVSSLNEALLAKEVVNNSSVIHLTTPGLRADEIGKISGLCDYLSFNSLSHWQAFQNQVNPGIKLGLRINPQLSFVDDERYNPCRQHSKLGVPLLELLKEFNQSNFPKGLSGLLFHSNCESTDFLELLETVQHLEVNVPGLLKHIRWLNLGGGYLINESKNLEVLNEITAVLKNKYELEVFFEPGKGIVGNAGYIVSSVIDLFKSDNRPVAVLDTTVNHMPEVFEYQFEPDIAGESANGRFRYLLAGASCLAGDVFGEYQFAEPLEIGSKIYFENVGAYTLVKASMFNGINLPSIYSYSLDGKLVLNREFDYSDFRSRYGVKIDDC